MPDLNAPMTESNKMRASVEDGWDYPIRIDVDYIIERFRKNHNLKMFKNNEHEYWYLVKKAIVVGCKMAEHYRENSNEKSRYKFDDIFISGGGGVNEKYNINVYRNVAFWQHFVGEIEIDFKKKTLSVWMNEWEDKNKGINEFNGRKLYKKEINNLVEVLNEYKEKYYSKQKD